jgi:hypothetical protein
MPLFSRRKAQLEKQQRAEAGAPVAMTAAFDQKARVRLLYAMRNATPSHLSSAIGYSRMSPVEMFLGLVHEVLLTEWGELRLAGKPAPHEDLMAFLLESASDEQVVDVLEATFVALVEAARRNEYPYGDPGFDTFRDRVNVILDEHDVAYQVVGSEVVPRASMALYSGVVAPVLSLLHGDPRLAKVESAFQEALRELKPGGSPDDAITDAARALQEMLVAIGCRGNTIGKLLDDAKGKGLLGPHDSKLALGVEQIGDWVSADRSERGDAHLVRETDADDAWLAVHVAGALVLRLEKRI